MKKIIRKSAFIALAIFFVGCSNGNSNKSNNEEIEETQETQEQTNIVEEKNISRPEKTEASLFQEIESIYSNTVSLYSSFTDLMGEDEISETTEKNLTERISKIKQQLDAIEPKTDNLSEDDYSKYTWSLKTINESEIKLESLK